MSRPPIRIRIAALLAALGLGAAVIAPAVCAPQDSSWDGGHAAGNVSTTIGVAPDDSSWD
jgi:hypothetical protein